MVDEKYAKMRADCARKYIMQSRSETTAKRAAHELLDSFPDSISWEEIAYHMEVRASIEAGLNDVREGRVVSHEEVKKHLGIK